MVMAMVDMCYDMPLRYSEVGVNISEVILDRVNGQEG